MRLMEWAEEEYKWKKREFANLNDYFDRKSSYHNPVKRRCGKSQNVINYSERLFAAKDK